MLFIHYNCVVKYAYLIWKFDLKYLYMSQTQRHIKSQSNTTYEVSYAISKPTTATFIPTETVETDEEKDCSRQESEVVYHESRLVEDKEAEGQA